MKHEYSLKQVQKEWHGTYLAYAVGFFASLILTTLAFFVRASHTALIALALTQALFQLHFFLHLGQEAKPKWESVTFYFMLLILLIVVFGTLWIMSDLNERMMPNMMEM